jgi:hypothetical protein
VQRSGSNEEPGTFINLNCICDGIVIIGRSGAEANTWSIQILHPQQASKQLIGRYIQHSFRNNQKYSTHRKHHNRNRNGYGKLVNYLQLSFICTMTTNQNKHKKVCMGITIEKSWQIYQTSTFSVHSIKKFFF